jgi:hypothetical protein
MKHFSPIQTIRTAALLLFTAAALSAQAQSPKVIAQETISYTFESSDGTNATSLVWVPSLQIYVTAIAGNEEFPMEAFNAKGDMLWTRMCGIDLRGMWWNEKAGRLEANAAGESGWYWLSATKNEPRADWENFVSGQAQPDFQSALTWTPKAVVGYYDGSLYLYKKGKLKKELSLSGYDDIGGLNMTTVAYTGNASYPLALFNYNDREVVFFDLKGAYKGKTKLPSTAANPDMFRFAFANGQAWTYYADSRTWTGYKVF